MKTIVGIAVAAVLSIGAANAAITSPGAGAGELIEFVVDNTTGTVYARGTQISETTILPASALLSGGPTGAYASAAPPVSPGATFAPIGPDGNLTTFLAQNTGHDSFSFGLLSAGQNTGGATGFTPGASVVEFTSPQSLAASNLIVPSGSLIQSNVASVQSTVTQLNTILAAAPGSSADVSGKFTSTSNEFNTYSDQIILTSALGTQVNLYAATGNSGKATTGQLYTAGLVTMLANGTLEQVVPTPLPAAVWLLGSGLLGLAGVGRRRNANATANA
jgi:hypothetical protein